MKKWLPNLEIFFVSQLDLRVCPEEHASTYVHVL